MIINVNEEFVEEMSAYRVASNKSFWGACNENVAVFAEKCLGFRFYAWQLRVISRINDPDTVKRVFAIITSRQIGKTETAAIYAFWSTFFNKLPGSTHNNTEVGVVSNSDDNAMKLVDRIKNWIDIADLYVKDNYKDGEGKSLFGDEFFSSRLNQKTGNNARTITWRPYDAGLDGEFILTGSRVGSVIRSLPPTRKILGGTYSLFIIDEAGDTKNIEDSVFYDYVDPTANRNDAKILLLSTPWQNSGFFYEHVDPDELYEERERVEVFGFTIDAVKVEDPEYHSRILKKIKGMEEQGRIDEVQRAYYCRFVKGEQSYFDPENVRAIFTPMHKKMSSYPKPCDLGVDFGAKKNSKTVITISCYDEDSGVINRLYDRVYGVGEDEDLIRDIESLLTVFNVQRIIPDDADTGQYMIREMVDKGWNVVPMSFRKDKVKKYGAFRGKLNTGKIFSYHDEELLVEMLALENSPSRSRTLIGAPPGYSDDKIDSWLCSCFFYLMEDEVSSGFVDYERKKSSGKKESAQEKVLKRLEKKKKDRAFKEYFGDSL